MNTFFSLLGICVLAGVAIYMYGRSRYREGSSDTKLSQAESNLKSQQEMTDEILKPRDTDKLRRKLRDGKF